MKYVTMNFINFSKESYTLELVQDVFYDFISYIIVEQVLYLCKCTAKIIIEWICFKC